MKENEFLQTQLAQFDAVADNLRGRMSEYENITIALFDEQAMATAKKDVRELRKIKNSIDTKRKELKQIYLEGGRAVDAEAKKYISIVDPVIEQRIEAIDKVTREMDAIRRKKANERTRELTDCGFEFSAGAYRLGSKVVHAIAIDETNDEDWKALIEAGKIERKRIEDETAQAKQLEAENKALKAKLAEMETPAPPKTKTTGAPFQHQSDNPRTSDRTEMFGDTPIEKPILYKNGFDAARTLAIAIVQKTASKKEIIQQLKTIEAWTKKFNTKNNKRPA